MMQTNQVERYLHTTKKAAHISDVAADLDLTYDQAACALKRLHQAGRAQRVGNGMYAHLADATALANLFIRTPAGHRLA